MKIARLANGQAVIVRPVQAGDVEQLTTLHLRLSPGTCHQRYLAARGFTADLSRAEAERIVAGRTQRHLAMVALAPRHGGDELIGVVEIVRLDAEEGLGELAIVVRDDMQGAGVGSLLMQAMATTAPILGLRALQIDVLAENMAMRRLAAQLGTPSVTWSGDGVLQLRLDLRHVPETQPGVLSRVSRMWTERKRRVA